MSNISRDLVVSYMKQCRDDRRGVGKSKNSYVKHNAIAKAVGAQIAAYRHRNKGRIVLIDGNAGDGIGVNLPEEGLFSFYPGLVDPICSLSTAELLVQVSERDRNADVILCERNPDRRAQLAGRFPNAAIIKNNSEILKHIQPHHKWGLWISDPCGPAGHGHEAMAMMARHMPCDFVIALNEQWIDVRLKATHGDAWEVARRRYLPMSAPQWWLDKLSRKHMSRSIKLYKIASNFGCRILVVGNFLSDGVKRRPFEVVK
jgi:hypothetical protein